MNCVIKIQLVTTNANYLIQILKSNPNIFNLFIIKCPKQLYTIISIVTIIIVSGYRKHFSKKRAVG